MSNWNKQRFQVHCRRQDELDNFISPKVKEILAVLRPDLIGWRNEVQAWLKEFDEYNVTYEYRSGYDEYETDTFPSDWLFDPDWKTKAEAIVRKEQEAQAAKDAKNQALKDEQDRKAYEALRKKFEKETA